MEQTSAPLYEELIRYIKRSQGNYHVPGHKQGNAFDTQGLEWYEKMLYMDLTEVGDLDDLHHPSGVILEAQQLAAKAFCAEQTFFLVGGTTAGNLATMLTLCRPGEEVIVQRSCHQSVFNGCILAGAKPITLPVYMDPETHLEQTIRVEHLEQLLEQYPSVKGVVVTSPSYYGVVQPLRELVALCHAYHVPLIVDEAHGAHFGFHSELPSSAMQCGADISIQSTHKMLTSMTMSSMLHVRGSRVCAKGIGRWLRVVQSSSPSYPLMVSLDLARRYVVNSGERRISELLFGLNTLRKKIQTFMHLKEVTSSHKQDLFKLTIQSDVYMISGYALQNWLEAQGHYVELADHRKVLFAFSMGTTQEQLEQLYQCLLWLDKIIPHLPQSEATEETVQLDYGQPAFSLEKVREGRHMEVSLEQAVNHVVTEMIVPYPPGIPFLLPGEYLTREKLEVLQEYIKSGSKVRGLSHKSSSLSICVLQ